MKYHFKVHKNKEGYWAECIELTGCRTQADSREELDTNMSEALNLFLSEPVNSKVVFPKPDADLKGKNVVEVPVEPNVAFATAIRQIRLKKKWTQTQMKEAPGFENLYSYQRLEDADSANPALKTLAMLKKSLPELSIDDLIED